MKRKIIIYAVASSIGFLFLTGLTTLFSVAVFLNTEGTPAGAPMGERLFVGWMLAVLMFVLLQLIFSNLYSSLYKMICVNQHHALRLVLEMEMLFKRENVYAEYILLDKLYKLTKKEQDRVRFETETEQLREKMGKTLETYQRMEKKDKKVFLMYKSNELKKMMFSASDVIDDMATEEKDNIFEKLKLKYKIKE